jgi:hypothetical protein
LACRAECRRSPGRRGANIFCDRIRSATSAACRRRWQAILRSARTIARGGHRRAPRGRGEISGGIGNRATSMIGPASTRSSPELGGALVKLKMRRRPSGIIRWSRMKVDRAIAEPGQRARRNDFRCHVGNQPRPREKIGAERRQIIRRGD